MIPTIWHSRKGKTMETGKMTGVGEREGVVINRQNTEDF